MEGLTEDITLILTDELGKSLDGKLKRARVYVNYLEDALDLATELGVANVLLIYRSHVASVEKR